MLNGDDMKSGSSPSVEPVPHAMSEETALRRACCTASAPAPEAAAMAAVASAVRLAATTPAGKVGAGVGGIGRV